MGSCEGCRYLQRELAAGRGKVFLRCMRREGTDGERWAWYGRVIEAVPEHSKSAPERPRWCEIENGYAKKTL